MPVAAIIVLAIVAYANALRNGFVLDDIPIIVENPVIRELGNAGTIFTTNYWSRGGGTAVGDPTLYRPLTVLSYAVDYAIWNLSPVAFHAMNVAFHAAVSVLVFVIAAAVLGSSPAAFAAAAIFAVHPVHTEAVTGVVGRAEVLAAAFFLAAFWVLRRRSTFLVGLAPENTVSRALAWSGLGGLLYLLGLFSKESAVTLPGVLALDDWLRRDELRGDRSRVVAFATRYGALASALAIYLVLRQHAVIGGSQIWPGFLGVPAGDRILTASRVLMEYVGLFVFPRTLLADYWKTEVPIATSLADPLVLLSFILWIGVAVLVFTRLRRDVAFILSVGWFFITVAPVSNIVFPIGVAKAERLLYLPSAGLCLLAGWTYARAETAVRSKSIPRVALAAVLVALTVRTVARNADWKDNFTLATATLAVSPSSPLMNDIAAEALVKSGEAKRAVPLLQEAVRQAPDMALIRSHLGAAYHAQGMLDEAIAEYQEAIRRHPADADAHNNLGVAYLDKGGREAEAVAAFNEAARLNPRYADPHINLGSLHLQRGRLPEATAEFAAAVQASPLNAEAHNALGVAYARQGQMDRAAASYREALRLHPAHAGARENLARLEAARAGAPR